MIFTKLKEAFLDEHQNVSNPIAEYQQILGDASFTKRASGRRDDRAKKMGRNIK